MARLSYDERGRAVGELFANMPYVIRPVGLPNLMEIPEPLPPLSAEAFDRLERELTSANADL